MIELEKEFVSGEGGFSANPLTYRQLKRSKNVAIYERSRDGNPRDYEVFFIKIDPKGKEHKFPNGVVKIVGDDTEKYPTTSQWGSIAWSYNSIGVAMAKFHELVHGETSSDPKQPVLKDSPEAILTVEDTPEENSKDTGGEGEEEEAKPYKGPDLLIPVGEFSTKELAEHNQVQYPIAFLFLKDQERKGKIKFTRKERRAAKGKPTSLFQLNPS